MCLLSHNRDFANHTEDIENEMQKIATRVNSYRSILENTLPVIVMLILGSWSDIHGRKFPLLFCTGGYILMPLVVASSLWFKSWSALTSSLLSCTDKLFGGELLFQMAGLSYITDVTDISTRTVRIGIYAAAGMLGVPLGFTLGGVFSRAHLGFPVSLGIASGLGLLSFLIILFGVKNIKNDEKLAELCKLKGSNGFCEGYAPKEMLLAILHTVSRKRPNGGRWVLLLLVLVMSVLGRVTLYGEATND